MIKGMDWTDFFADETVTFTRQTKRGYRDNMNGGQWVEEISDPVIMSGIVLPLGNSDLRFDVIGKYNRTDLKLYILAPQELKKDDIINYEGESYRIFESRDYSEYANFTQYVLRRADAGEVNNAES